MKSLILSILILVSCASSTASSRGTTLSNLESLANASRQSLVAYDKARQDAIVAASTDLPSGKAALASFRAKVTPIETALAAAYDAIQVATSLNDDHSLQGAETAVNTAVADIQALIGGAK